MRFNLFGAVPVVVLWGVLLVSCTQNIQPLPDDIRVSSSASLPLGFGEITLSKSLQTLGLPILNLHEDVPEWAKYGFVYYADTLPLNLTEVFDRAEYIKYLAIRCNVWNDFPLGGMAQMYFLDGDGTTIDSLYHERFTVPAAQHYDNGIVAVSKFESSLTKFDSNRINLISNAQKVIILAGLEVTDEGVNATNIKYFDMYKLKVQIAVRVDFVYNSD